MKPVTGFWQYVSFDVLSIMLYVGCTWRWVPKG